MSSYYSSFFFFFFSSRRRHTRFKCDWSSDVCSSDLTKSLTRMTIPDVLRLIESQTSGKFEVNDFVPVPCCFPTCNSVTYAFIDGETVTPLPRIVNVYDYLDYITNRVVPDFSHEIRGALEGLWSSSSVAGSKKSADQLALSCQACGLPETITVGNIAQHMIMIMLQDFMDLWTFHQKNLMKF